MGTVVGLFETRDKAQRAVEALRRAGFRDEDISLVARDRGEAGITSTTATGETTHTSGGGAEAGAVGGGLLGSLAGLALGMGALAIPGIGPIVAAGPLAAILAGGAIGAVGGGILGSLVESGVPEDEARHYQSGVERGAVLLTVHAPEGRDAEARSILQRNGLRDLSEHRNEWESKPNFTYDEHETRIKPETHRSDDMSTKKTTEDRDKATVDAKAGGTMTGGAAGAVVGGVVGGPVGAGVGAVVGSAIGGAAGSAFDYKAAEPEFRSHWEQSHHKAGSHETWEDASSAYRYGWESFDRPEYRNKSWDEVHPHIQKSWTGKKNWTEYEPLVREAWDRRTQRHLGAGGEAVVPVVEEEVKIGKRKVETGGVRVETHVTETPVREDVHLHEERVDVTRRPVSRAATGEDIASAFQEGTIEVKKTAEEAVVSKKPKVVEEVVIKKEGRDRTETVHETARRTDVEVKETTTPTKVTDEGVVKDIKGQPRKG